MFSKIIIEEEMPKKKEKLAFPIPKKL